MQVTTKGAGLNPNAKVWQEIPAQQNESPGDMDSAPWLHACPPPAEMTEGQKNVCWGGVLIQYFSTDQTSVTVLKDRELFVASTDM